jgi:hypothetical protein
MRLLALGQSANSINGEIEETAVYTYCVYFQGLTHARRDKYFSLRQTSTAHFRTFTFRARDDPALADCVARPQTPL